MMAACLTLLVLACAACGSSSERSSDPDVDAATDGATADAPVVRNGNIDCAGRTKICKQDECACFDVCSDSSECGSGLCCGPLMDALQRVCQARALGRCDGDRDAAADAPSDAPARADADGAANDG